jgi:uncharacterized protein (DUF58 family)
VKPWHFAVLWIALFIVAASTGLELLSYLSYLLLFVAVIAWVQARMTLDGLSIKRALSQSYAHLGDTIELVYELRNDASFGKLWLEISEESNWPEPLPGRVLSIGGKGKTRKWKVLAKAIRRGRYKLGPIILRSGDPFGLFPKEERVATEALLLVYPLSIKHI